MKFKLPQQLYKNWGLTKLLENYTDENTIRIIFEMQFKPINLFEHKTIIYDFTKMYGQHITRHTSKLPYTYMKMNINRILAGTSNYCSYTGGYSAKFIEYMYFHESTGIEYINSLEHIGHKHSVKELAGYQTLH